MQFISPSNTEVANVGTSNNPFYTRRSPRLPGYDYRSEGLYFVTICAEKMRLRFGTILNGELQLNRLGQLVSDEWQRLAIARANVKLDQFVVMPNHLHGLIDIGLGHERDSRQISSGDTRSVTIQAGSLGAIVGQFKAAVSRRAKTMGIADDTRIWQRGYYDHIVRSERSLNEIRRYILENPAKWLDDRLYAE